MTKHLELLIPASRWPDEQSRAAIWQDLPLPSLKQLYGKARKTKLAHADFAAFLAAQFGLETLAVAPLMLARDVPDAEPGFWLRADPVTLRVDRDHLTVLGEPFFSITQTEAEQLVDGLNKLYQADGYRFVAASATRWYLRLPQDPQLRFTPLKAALGKNLNDVLPKGEGALAFNALMNEMQMLLYAHPVNDQRDAQGLPLINSVWLWGAGQAPLTNPPRPQRAVFGADALIQTLSGQAQMPSRFSDVTQQNVLIVLDQLETHAIYGDGYAWRQVWQQWEDDWFAPALAALQSGELTSLTLTFSDVAEQATVRKADLWRFWRKGALPCH